LIIEGLSIAVIIRHSYERSLDKLEASIQSIGFSEDDIIKITANSFAENLKKSVDAGLECDCDWICMLDGDLILDTNKFTSSVKFLKECHEYLEVQFLVEDWFFGELRPAGNHFYNKKYLKDFKRFLPQSEKGHRPETEALKAAGSKGLKWKTIPFAIGHHDYYQSNYDIFCKGYQHSKKHLKELPRIISNLRQSTYKRQAAYALEGLIYGMRDQKSLSLSRDNAELRQYFEQLKVSDDIKDVSEMKVPQIPKVINLNGKIIVSSGGKTPSFLLTYLLVLILNIQIKIANKFLNYLNTKIKFEIVRRWK